MTINTIIFEGFFSSIDSAIQHVLPETVSIILPQSAAKFIRNPAVTLNVAIYTLLLSCIIPSVHQLEVNLCYIIIY